MKLSIFESKLIEKKFKIEPFSMERHRIVTKSEIYRKQRTLLPVAFLYYGGGLFEKNTVYFCWRRAYHILMSMALFIVLKDFAEPAI